MGNLDKHKIFQLLLSINLLLVFAYLYTNQIYVFPIPNVRHWFDLDAEANIPTWFSSAQLLALFALSICCSSCSHDKDSRAFYVLMAFFFLFFSIDETSKIHEGLTVIFKKVSIETLFPDAHGMWILVYPVILCLFLLIFRKGFLAFLNQKPGRTMFIIGASVFVAGGVGFEILGYYFAQNELDLFYAVEITIEESSELLGQSIMIFALISKLELLSFDNTISESVHTAKKQDTHKGSVININDPENKYI